MSSMRAKAQDVYPDVYTHAYVHVHTHVDVHVHTHVRAHTDVGARVVCRPKRMGSVTDI